MIVILTFCLISCKLQAAPAAETVTPAPPRNVLPVCTIQREELFLNDITLGDVKNCSGIASVDVCGGFVYTAQFHRVLSHDNQLLVFQSGYCSASSYKRKSQRVHFVCKDGIKITKKVWFAKPLYCNGISAKRT